MPLLEKLKSEGPKRILALDGGGIRGALTLGYLQRIENILRDRYGNPNLLLCDYFDLIGGTSTGSIIASALAIGLSVEEIKNKYLELGEIVFKEKLSFFNIFKIRKTIKAAFDEGPLEEELEKFFGDIKLGGKEIKTGLCIVAKRADTQSVWPLINHPEGIFYDSKHAKNKDILLRNAIRASAAAPTYFVPNIINVGGGIDPNKMERAAFVDGGVSMSNNPALQLFLLAILEKFPFHWKKGEDNLFIVSLGTGKGDRKETADNIVKRWLLDWAQNVPNMLMQDADWQNQLILQLLSNSPTARHLNSEIGDLSNDLLTKEPALSYVRYNTILEVDPLKKLGFNFTRKQTDSLQEMSDAKNCATLYDIGVKASLAEIKEDHFPTSFDSDRFKK